jgi:hypothetical protein
MLMADEVRVAFVCVVEGIWLVPVDSLISNSTQRYIKPRCAKGSPINHLALLYGVLNLCHSIYMQI